jgi:hypothetical protein
MLMDGAEFDFTVVEYAADGASDDKLARFAGDYDAPELAAMDFGDVDADDIEAVARTIAEQWTPSHPAATVWRVKVRTSSGYHASAWDPASVPRPGGVAGAGGDGGEAWPVDHQAALDPAALHPDAR